MRTPEKFEQYKAGISEKYPSLSSVYGTADSLKLYLEDSGDGVVQNIFYNDWKSDHFVCAVLLLVPSGRISSTIFNAPGCMHDSRFPSGVAYKKNSKTFSRKHEEQSLQTPLLTK